MALAYSTITISTSTSFDFEYAKVHGPLSLRYYLRYASHCGAFRKKYGRLLSLIRDAAFAFPLDHGIDYRVFHDHTAWWFRKPVSV